jgi:hypothetical protein
VIFNNVARDIAKINAPRKQQKLLRKLSQVKKQLAKNQFEFLIYIVIKNNFY